MIKLNPKSEIRKTEQSVLRTFKYLFLVRISDIRISDFAAFLILFLIFISTSFAGTATDPSLSGLAARQLGMGGAGIALPDVNDVFLNPAGIAYLKDFQLSATSTTLLTEIKQNIIAGANKTQWGTFGLGFINVNMGGSLPTMRDPTNLGRIIVNPSVEAMSQDSTVVVLSYAKRFEYRGDISLGINLKTFNQSLTGTSDVASRGTATNVDLGLMYNPEQLNWLTAALVYQNALGGSLGWSGASSASDSMGGSTRIGALGKLIGRRGIGQIGSHEVLAEMDLEFPRGTLASSASLVHIGAEWRPINELYLRAGLDQRNASTNITYGIGISRGGFRFDYAFKAGAISEDTSHVFSLCYAPEENYSRVSKRGPLALRISHPLSTTTNEAVILIRGSIENADNVTAVRINGYPAMPFVSKNYFEVYWNPLVPGTNRITVEAFTTSPEAGSAQAVISIMRTAPIKDVKADYFATDAINYLESFRLMGGYPDGTFRPENPMTRAELVTLLVKAQGPPRAVPKKGSFKDLNKKHWAFGPAETAVSEKLVGGYPDKTFRPSKFVTRAESSVIMTKFAGLHPLVLTPPYSDIPASHWASKYITAAKDAGMLTFIDTSSFEGSRAITRGEVAYMLSKTAKVEERIKTVLSVPATPETVSTGEVVELILPPEGARTYYDLIIVSGRSLTNVIKDITVNSLKIRAPYSGSDFSGTLNLKKGENLIDIRALDALGTELKGVRRIVIKE